MTLPSLNSTLPFVIVETLPSTSLPSLTSNVKEDVTVSPATLLIFVQPFGAAVSSSVYVPFLSPLNTASFPSNVTEERPVAASFSAAIAFPSIVTPLRSEPVSLNEALLSSASFSPAPRSSLDISTVDFLSSTVSVLPSSESFTSPSVETVVLSFLTTPFSTSKRTFVTVMNPSGAAVSVRVYLPSLSPVIFIELPSMSMDF